MRGCGICNCGVSMVRRSYKRMSRSMVRGPLITVRTRPSFCSTNRQCSNNSTGDNLVATLTTALRNLFCGGPPTGAVSMTADVFRTLMPFFCNKPMACPMFPARSPRFEPNPMYAMLNDSLRINPYKTFFNRSTASCRRSLGTVRAMRIYPSPASPKPLPGVTTMSALSKNALPVSMELENPFGIFAQT